MTGPIQLVQSGNIDYLVFDYLAETTMSILAAARMRKPELGYATDFVDIAMKSVLAQALKNKIRIITNAGGMNPRGCADALLTLSGSMGLAPRVAVVEGDDISGHLPALRSSGARDMFTNQPLPASVLSANAYLGALPIAQALDQGADIVITGRGVDSAVTLGALIHEFKWTHQDYDLLAGGSLAGHIIECGCQATGGLFTDWEMVPDWANMGYPIVECYADGSFILSKPPNTGGVILRAAAAEQLLYEIGDPSTYQLPDVICDFRQVHIEQLDSQHVKVSGARGRAPSNQYKISATALDGWRCTGTLVIIGIDAAAKARRTGYAVIERVRNIYRQLGIADFSSATVELLGAETLYGPHSQAGGSREVMVRIIVNHASKDALGIFAREIAPAGTSWSPGTTGPGGGRPSPSPCIKSFSFMIDKAAVAVSVRLPGQDQQTYPVHIPIGQKSDSPAATIENPPARDSLQHNNGAQTQIKVPLIRLAWARSGDKGDIANIGVIAREPQWFPLLWEQVTPQAVASYLAHLVKGPIERYYLPGIDALNLVMYQALDGGGTVSTRNDPLGKGMAQILLEMPILMPLRALSD
jgi:hypothetical protein